MNCHFSDDLVSYSDNDHHDPVVIITMTVIINNKKKHGSRMDPYS